MRPLFVLPAVLVPLALVALLAAARRIGHAADALRRELHEVGQLQQQVTALRPDLEVLHRRSRQRPPRGRSGR